MNKERFIEMLNKAKEDEYGRLYVLGKYNNKIYFGAITTICEDIFALNHSKECQDTAELYDRHFWNDDTLNCYVVSTKHDEDIEYKEPKSYKIYDLVKYNGYEWIVINVKNDKLTLMMKNCLPEEKMKEIFNNDYLNKNFDIKYSLDKKCNDWNKTEIKKGLNNEFLKEFNKEELVKMKTNYDEDKYSYDYIRIPKIREIERLNQDKIVQSITCWIMSPSHFNASNDHVFEWILTNASYLSYAWVTNSYGVRPVITLKSDNQKIEKVGTV